MAYYDLLESPVGTVFVGGSAEGIHRVDFLGGDREVDWFLGRLAAEAGVPLDDVRRDPVAAAEATRQLREYFAGERTVFDLPLAPRGTEFQRRVWMALREIPAGETRSYGQIAARLGQPTASRAVGAANGQNPLAVVVPCHRVVGANGTLTGYAGGLDRKAWLLDHEARALPLFAAAAGMGRK
jgi:methylated-DNA-[protein]-cysteine S-methyltransferase